MKIVAIGEIHYEKDGKMKVAAPGETFDVPKELAMQLVGNDMPSARRMTEQEIELDKLRAEVAASSTAVAVESETPAVETQKADAKPAKVAKKGADAEGY